MKTTEKSPTTYLEKTQRIVVITYYAMQIAVLNHVELDIPSWAIFAWNITKVAISHMT